MGALLYVQVAEALEKEIRDGDAPIGTPLPSERALAEKYHVSRNVIRQALSQLADKNLIERIPDRGATISYSCDEKVILTIKQLLLTHQSSFLDALEIREVLELAIIDRCIPYVTDEFIDQLQAIWDEMEQDRQSMKVAHFLKGDAAFHELLAKTVPNPMFHLLLQTVFSFSPLSFFEFSRTLESVVDDTQREHYRILAGLRARNPEIAHHAMQVHMHNIRLDLEILNTGFQN